jgi:hypothetical protein
MRSIGDRRKETAGAYQPYHVRADPRASRLDRGEILDWSFRTRVTHCVSLFLRAGRQSAARRAVEGSESVVTRCMSATQVSTDVRQLTYVEKFAFGDRTITYTRTHAEGSTYLPNGWTCTTVQNCLLWCTLTTPPLERTHTSNPAFPTGGWVGRFRFLCRVAVLDVVAIPLEGDGPTLPLWGGVVTWLCGVLVLR